MAINSFARAGLSRVTLPPNANFSNTATGTFTDAGVNYKYVTFNSSGTLTVTAAGVADVFILAGGGGARSTGAGAGGLLLQQTFIDVASYTVTVGAGGASGVNGGESAIHATLNKSMVAFGGGQGTIAWNNGVAGGCGGGAANTIGGAALFSQGFRGGESMVGVYSGGGGQGGVGVASGNGGPGISSTFTGSAVSRAAGGRSASGSADGTFWTGIANSGDGGRYLSDPGSAGHSGVVIIRVRTN